MYSKCVRDGYAADTYSIATIKVVHVDASAYSIESVKVVILLMLLHIQVAFMTAMLLMFLHILCIHDGYAADCLCFCNC